MVYAGCAALLKYRVRIDVGLPRLRDLAWLLLLGPAASALVALGFVSIYAAAGLLPAAAFPAAALQYWIGDAIGIAVTTPLVLVGAAWLRGLQAHDLSPARAGRPAPLALAEAALQSAAVAAAILLIFLPESGREGFRYFYLLFLPIVWIAVRRGLAGAICAVVPVQMALVAALQLQHRSTETFRDYQLLMLTLAFTGLLLGSLVSERERSLRALAAGETRMQAILASAPDAVITVDAGGEVESFNRGAERLFRIASPAACGRPLAALLPEPDLLDRVGRLAAGGRTQSDTVDGIETMARRGDGLELPVELTAGWLDTGTRPRYTLVVRDVTLRKEHTARLRERESALFHVSRVSVAGEMASGIAHELNQPLTAILAYAEGCRRLVRAAGAAPHGLAEGIEEIASQAGRAGAIIKRLREFMREGATRRAPVPLAQIVEESLGLVHAEAVQHAVKLHGSAAADLPRVVVDRIQIEQVLVNLLRNAIDSATAKPLAERHITVTASITAARFAVLGLADTGAGVPEHLASRLFHPFVTSKPRGMGLGLSISRTIVEAHGGRLWLAANGPDGATFHLTLPTEASVPDDAG